MANINFICLFPQQFRGDYMADERYMKMTPEEKKVWREKRKPAISPQTQGFYPKPGPGRENQVFARAATRRAAGTYVANN